MTYTCQILVGDACSPCRGLAPGSLRQLLLTEEDRPAWRLFDFSTDGPRRPLAMWIPEALETALEDAFLMIAVHIARDPLCRDQLMPYLSDGGYGLDMASDLPSGIAESARELCRRSTFVSDIAIKAIVAPFYDSSIISQLSLMDQYCFEYEVLEPRLHHRGRIAHSRTQSLPPSAIAD